VFDYLQIPYRRERTIVGLADLALRGATSLGWPRHTHAAANPPRRILLLRLERVGDLLMVRDALADVRALAPQATIDLVVGTWNAALAALIPNVDSIETLDVPWMAREGQGLSWSDLRKHARAWRARRYDLAINFEPDIRSNLLIAWSGAPRRVGFLSGGGGSLLTDSVAPDPRAHIAENARELVRVALGRGTPATGAPKLAIPTDARRRAADLVAAPRHGAPLVGIQPGAGRRIKEWDPARFAEAGATLARNRGASVVLIGGPGDRTALEAVRAAWPKDVPLAELPPDLDLVALAAVLERLSLFITGDTGPMHLAAAVGTPVLAIFGPSLPTRYAPLTPRSKIVRVDIHCSPCNLMRRPPTRCLGRVPECLTGVMTADVLRAADALLDGA
jgi:lipopolysaccharide heptosyltransferase II